MIKEQQRPRPAAIIEMQSSTERAKLTEHGHLQ